MATLFLGPLPAAVREVDTVLASGIAVRVTVPEAVRHPEAVPVVVQVADGWSAGELSWLGAPLATQGFVEIRFRFPEPLDQRGPRAAQALAAVLAYAAGAPDREGHRLAELCAPLATAERQIGVIGWGVGGNVAVQCFAQTPAASRAVAWLVMWETPAIDGAPTALLGDRESGPLPLYDPTARTLATEGLRYDPACPLPGQGAVAQRGAFWFDIDGDGQRTSADRLPRALPVPFGEGTRWVYPAWLTEVAVKQLRFSDGWPAHLFGVGESREFWAARLATGHYLAASDRRPDRLVMVVGSREDHHQAAPDHPHLFAAYDGWRQTGTWVRLNPDGAALAALRSGGAPEYREVAANRPLTRAELPATLPDGALSPALLVTAAACELADRVRAGERRDDLDALP